MVGCCAVCFLAGCCGGAAWGVVHSGAGCRTLRAAACAAARAAVAAGEGDGDPPRGRQSGPASPELRLAYRRPRQLRTRAEEDAQLTAGLAAILADLRLDSAQEAAARPSCSRGTGGRRSPCACSNSCCRAGKGAVGIASSVGADFVVTPRGTVYFSAHVLVQQYQRPSLDSAAAAPVSVEQEARRRRARTAGGFAREKLQEQRRYVPRTPPLYVARERKRFFVLVRPRRGERGAGLFEGCYRDSEGWVATDCGIDDDAIFHGFESVDEAEQYGAAVYGRLSWRGLEPRPLPRRRPQQP